MDKQIDGADGARRPDLWRRWGALALMLATVVATPRPALAEPAMPPADPHATRETRALMRNLDRVSKTAVLFGHQNDLAYGYGWVDVPGGSDVKAVTGAYPALYGWDVMDVFGRDGQAAPDKAAKLRGYIQQGYRQGAVIALSWHERNIVSGGDAWDTKTPAVDAILPGGDHHEAFIKRLDVVADFIASLKDDAGRPIPVVFRPWHEHTGGWFWWGAGHTTPDAFKALWRMTVTHLRDERGLHNVLYAYSTDVFDTQAAYLERYPGDDIIDVLGFDDYQSIKTAATVPVFTARLVMLNDMARRRGKLAAVTETGLEALPDPAWWTNILLKGLRGDPRARGVAWVMVWRNANPATDRKEHFYAPYPGQKSADDFVRFHQADDVLFGDELPKLYDAQAQVR
jgi:mannan endo-1,4-beta-mannosidase